MSGVEQKVTDTAIAAKGVGADIDLARAYHVAAHRVSAVERIERLFGDHGAGDARPPGQVIQMVQAQNLNIRGVCASRRVGARL